MQLTEVEEILGCYGMLGAPMHMIMVNEPVRERLDGVMAYFRGLQPKHRSDTIVLTPQAVPETVPHELVHTMGLGEMAAYPLGRVLVWKYRLLRNVPVLGSALARQVRYKKCGGCDEFALLHQQYAGRAEHFVRCE